MPRICEFYGIVIYMYFYDHNPPHFHAEYGDEEVQLDIGSLGILAGSIPARQLGRVVEWAALHRVDLEQNWDLASAGLPLQPIDPL